MGIENVYSTWDGYGLRHMAEHLAFSEDAESLKNFRKILLDFDYLQTKLHVVGLEELISDYNLFPDNTNIQVIKEALRLSTHVLIQDPNQLAGQLLGRLLSWEATTLRLLGEQNCSVS